MIQLDLIFVKDIRSVMRFMVLPVDVQLFPHQLLLKKKNTLLLNWLFPVFQSQLIKFVWIYFCYFYSASLLICLSFGQYYPILILYMYSKSCELPRWLRGKKNLPANGRVTGNVDLIIGLRNISNFEC